MNILHNVYRQHYAAVASARCTSSFSTSTSTELVSFQLIMLIVEVISVSSGIASQVIILLATWLKTWSIHGSILEQDGMSGMTLSRMIARDGENRLLRIDRHKLTVRAGSKEPYILRESLILLKE